MTSQPETQPLDQLTDSELQRLIAEMRGWTDLITYPLETDLLYGSNWKQGYSLMSIPNWPQDTHAAVVDLLAETNYMIWFNGVEWEVSAILEGEPGDGWAFGFSIPIIASHENPARAIALAWVEWKRGEK